MTKLISITEVEPGMICAAPVKSRHGQILIKPETVLSEKHKKFLLLWGIESITVIGSAEVKSGEANSSGSKTEDELALESRLGWVPSNPHEKDLFEMALQSALEKKAGNE